MCLHTFKIYDFSINIQGDIKLMNYSSPVIINWEVVVIAAVDCLLYGVVISLCCKLYVYIYIIFRHAYTLV